LRGKPQKWGSRRARVGGVKAVTKKRKTRRERKRGKGEISGSLVPYI